MSKRVILVVSALVLALAVAGLTAFTSQRENGVEINQAIAGSIFNGIEVTSNSTTVNRALLNLYAKGAPGAANIEAVGGSIPVIPPSGLCPDGTDFELMFVDGGVVETFSDHSLLFYAIDTDPGADNRLCLDFEGPNTGVFDYVITGGAGRFEGATGSATVEVISWGITQELSAEAGTIRGMVQLP